MFQYRWFAAISTFASTLHLIIFPMHMLRGLAARWHEMMETGYRHLSAVLSENFDGVSSMETSVHADGPHANALGVLEETECNKDIPEHVSSISGYFEAVRL
jgi:hypothetical protein